MKFNLAKLIALTITSALFVSCASMPPGSQCDAGDVVCQQTGAALDQTKTCEKNSDCEAARRAFEGGKECTGWNDNDGLCLSFTQGLGPNACFKDDVKCVSVKMAVATAFDGGPLSCPATDSMCKSLRKAGFSKAAAAKFTKK